MDEAKLARCQEILGYRFRNPDLLSQALTHASAATTRVESNERLEFLGDSVLSTLICEEIYSREPALLEGAMTKIKSSVVSRRTCAEVADACGITELLVLGKGVSTAAALPMSLGAAVFEAVIGAMYLDGGLEPVRRFVLSKMSAAIDAAMASEP